MLQYWRFALSLTLPLAMAGCPGETAPPAGNVGTIVVGLTSDLRAGVDVETMHVRMLGGGQVLRDEILKATGPSGAKLEFPLDLPFADRPDGEDAEITLEAFSKTGTSALLTRTAKSRIVAGKSLLLRMHLESECAGVAAPACAAGQTCIGGVCSEPFVDPSKLGAYKPTWNDGSPDICKPSGAGAPVIVVGEGMSDYLPIDDLAVAQVEAGPQGGHHIWVAIRMKNLHQSGSITEVKGHIPELDLDVPPFNVIFTFEQDEGGYCKLYGLRYQLDTATEIEPLLGKVIEVTVSVRDPDGTVGTATKVVTLSSDFIG